MSSISDEEIDIYRRIAAEATSSRQFKGTIVATSYDPKSHSVKGILVPHGIETGWIPLQAIGTGSGSGLYYGPKPGDAQKLDGDQLDVEFDQGDPNTIVAKHRMTKPDKPPQVESGEVMMPFDDGHSKLFRDKDGNLTVNGKADGQQLYLDKDGNSYVKAGGATAEVDKDGNITLTDKNNGVVYLSGGKIYLGSKTASNAVETTAGPSTKVFAVV